jgi:MoaA/NifB/PqqE/SkfB family radical SAM enzyme
MEYWDKLFAAIEEGTGRLCGPHTLQIDLTDRCNNDCIGCWVHSPLLDKGEIFPNGKKDLPFSQVRHLIEDSAKLGVREIILSGSGEPFLYPEIEKVIKLIKNRGIYLNIITNALLMEKKPAELLVKYRVDLITASIWAGSPEIYSLTHPGKKNNEFWKIKKNLLKLAYYKKKYKSLLPHLKIYNVICSKNYSDLEAMVEFAKAIDSDSVEFQVVDIIPGQTDSLALGRKHKQEIINQLKRIRQKEEMVFFNFPRDINLEELIEKENLDFGKVWKDRKKGFSAKKLPDSLVCPKGYQIDEQREIVSESISVTETKPAVFWYKFKSDFCKSCENRNSCLARDKAVSVKLLSILGIGTLLRRIFRSDLEKGIYEKQINYFPCYIGWYYARILTDGTIIPCCKAVNFPLGNIGKDSFFNTWNSPAYHEFRKKAKNLNKSDPYFAAIDCLRSCDNWGMNLTIGKRLKQFKNINPLIVKNQGQRIIIFAKSFTAGNLNTGEHNFGKNIVIDGGQKEGFARYLFKSRQTKNFEFWARYASGSFRPVDIYIDGKIVKKSGLSEITGGWTVNYLKWNKETEVKLTEGEHILEINSKQCIPHIEQFGLFETGALPRQLKKESKAGYWRMFNEHILDKGLAGALRRVFGNLTPERIRDRYLEMLGIYDREYGYKGPFHVQIDLTNDCNNNCIACWCNSPLYKKPRLSKEEKKQYLPFRLVKELLDEISQMGATEVYYSGSGEPFMHPRIMEILEYTKKKGLICHVNTNFTLLNKERLDRLIEIGLDYLTVSTWAGSKEIYAKTHPNKTESEFEKIKDNLIYLNKNKKCTPSVKLYNVLFNMNYFEIDKMIEFAKKTASESVEFTLVDTVPGVTDVLALGENQLKELKRRCEDIQYKLERESKLKGSSLTLFQFDQFLRRVSNSVDARQAKYDKGVIDSMPCYIGWLFARIVPNGEVHSCLKAHRIPTGSLYSKKFSEIWNSPQQANFRKKTCVLRKDDPFFRLIGNDPEIKEAGCYKSCDDIGRNSWMHKRMTMLTRPEKAFLKVTAKGLKLARKLNLFQKASLKQDKNLRIAGIRHGRKAFQGPEQVVVDLTNRCNLRCLSCWLYSPLLTGSQPSYDLLNQELPGKKVFKLIDDLASMGTERIRFTGGGEPLIHKDFFRLAEYASKRGLLVGVTTNFGLMDKKGISRLVNAGLEELCISIWASNSGTYCDVHPGTDSRYFEKLKNNLAYLQKMKTDKPRITFANVIMNKNVNDFMEMYNFGRKFGADALYFTIVDILSGQTDSLLLNPKQRDKLKAEALAVKEKAGKEGVELEFFEGFMNRLGQSKEDFQKGEYDKSLVNQIPCYAGWIFSRILADGSIAPCCRGVKKIMGNINKESFKNIWFSDKYNEFRAKAKYLSKQDSYFKEIGCTKECDNLMHNQEMERRIVEG